ncbi:MAG: bifunctional NADP-dependent methylenetetrahydromethanopterin dehydrogenase/methylenetetrahydrofolate dehydrogenase [Planctomycetales bacterium]|nr:bifunctional NADP-dependent methylenetetrahydromethanopterin dehydrogenase/methylenetetrahydrofolate dehydrogenase [Planctomycetales bacterium]
MSDKPRILFQLDPDKHASSFDAVVAIDSGVQHLVPYSSVSEDDVQNLVYGGIFTRGPSDLKSTAIFIGGTNVEAGERLAEKVASTFFGPMRISVMIDPNGANTTASAAVVAAGRHAKLQDATATVLAGTGPVGQRVCRLLAAAGASVRVGSRSEERAVRVCDQIHSVVEGASIHPFTPTGDAQLQAVLNETDLLFAAGTTGVQLAPNSAWADSTSLKVAIDLNAVPPLGIEGIEVMDAGADRSGKTCYGAIGVGGTKMKIHKAAIARLFEQNDLFLDAAEIYEIGCGLE